MHLNDLGACESTAYLVQYDSVHGTWAHQASADGDATVVLRGAGRELRVPYSRAKAPAELAAAYKAAGVELVLECTGAFLTRAALAPYFEACGARKVVVSAPVKDPVPVLNVVVGCNDGAYDASVDHIVTAASCTTNCLAPVVKVRSACAPAAVACACAAVVCACAAVACALTLSQTTGHPRELGHRARLHHDCAQHNEHTDGS